MTTARGFGILLSVAVAVSGCAPFGAPHTTLHPSRVGGTNAAGVSVGSVFTTTSSEPEGADTDVDSTSFAVPYGEGWARFGTGSGQFEVRATSNAVSFGYRADLAKSGGLTVGLQPALSAGYWSTSSEADLDGGDTSVSALTISPTLAFVVVVGGGAFYLGPRFGYQYSSFRVEDSDGDETSTSSGSFAFGSAFGTILDGAAFDYSFELGAYGFMGSGETDTGAGPDAEVDSSGFLFVATVGLQLGR